MQKRLLLIFLLVLVPSVYSLSLFPKDNNIINTIQIASLKEVHYDKKNTLELVIESNYNKGINGIIVNIQYQDNNKNTIIINEDLNPYSTKIYQINTKNQPISLDIKFFSDSYHKRSIFNQIESYQITGNEKNIIQPPQQITIQENQQIQSNFNNNPNYISYSPYSKLDDNKNIIYFTKDHISSNRITTNNQGNIQYKANYQPYGRIFKETGEESYKYSNKELDSSNLYYFGARYYDPSIGRFTQVDPIFKLQESPYMYANNNPIKYVDPTGMIKEGATWSRIPNFNEDDNSRPFTTVVFTSLLDPLVGSYRADHLYFATQDFYQRYGFVPETLPSLYYEYWSPTKSGIQAASKRLVEQGIRADLLIISGHGTKNSIWADETGATQITTQDVLDGKYDSLNKLLASGSMCILTSCNAAGETYYDYSVGFSHTVFPYDMASALWSKFTNLGFMEATSGESWGSPTLHEGGNLRLAYMTGKMSDSVAYGTPWLFKSGLFKTRTSYTLFGGHSTYTNQHKIMFLRPELRDTTGVLIKKAEEHIP